MSKKPHPRGAAWERMPGVGTASSDNFSLDGKGHFTLEHRQVTGVAGGTIAGSFGNDDKTSGEYKLKDGEIILRFRNGTVSKHAFFYSPPGEEDLIVLNGEFYFREEETEPVAPAGEKNTVPAAAELLNRLRNRYGDEEIDKITTVKETATITGNFQAVLFTDITNRRIRIEVRQGGKLLLVKQLEGDDGWQWMNGTKTPLPENDKNELQITLYQGILGLHKKLNHYFSKATVTTLGNDYMLTFHANNTKVVYLIGKDYSLKGNAYSVTETPSITVYKNFATKNGITYPTVAESKTGNQTVTATTTSIEINPVLTAEVWKTP